MSTTASTMLPLGSALPDFTLVNAVDGSELRAPRGANGTLVMFICNHCPYVIHIRSKLTEVAHRALDNGFAVVAINSNSVATHPQDGPEQMKQLASSERWRFPFLFDSTQSVAHAFKAACTPDLFLFDARAELVYRGQFDDARPSKPTAVTGRDLSGAIDALLAGQRPDPAQIPSIGCNIKWHPQPAASTSPPR